MIKNDDVLEEEEKAESKEDDNKKLWFNTRIFTIRGTVNKGHTQHPDVI